jgi:hypothetical protein
MTGQPEPELMALAWQPLPHEPLRHPAIRRPSGPGEWTSTRVLPTAITGQLVRASSPHAIAAALGELGEEDKPGLRPSHVRYPTARAKPVDPGVLAHVYRGRSPALPT